MTRISMRSLRNQFYSALFTILFVILYPSFIILFIPVYLWRFVVSVLKKVFRPDLDKLIVTRSSILAIDNPYKSPKWNLVVWLVLDEEPDTDKFKETFLQDIVLRKTPEGKLADPEFRQYYYKWLGFLFWKWEENFDINQHMHFESKSETEKLTTLKEFMQIIKKLTWAPFKDKTSPWEFVAVNKCDYESDGKAKFIGIFRVHHGFSDGFAILRLLLQQLCGVSLATIAKPENFRHKSRNQRIRDALSFPFLAPYQFCKMLVQSSDRNDWHKSKECDFTRPFNFAFSQRIPVDFIKTIKNAHEVSFTAVVMSAIAGGVRRSMIKQGIAVPKNFSAGVPVPMPGHPSKMRNHFIFAFLKIPVGISDSIERLKKTEQNVANLKHSYAPLLNFSMIPFAGGLCNWLMKGLNKNPFSTAIISNFPGPSIRGQFRAAGSVHTVTDMNFSGGLGGGNVGMGFSILSYGDSLRICTEADRSILSTDTAVQELIDEIMKEFQLLHEISRV